MLRALILAALGVALLAANQVPNQKAQAEQNAAASEVSNGAASAGGNRSQVAGEVEAVEAVEPPEYYEDCQRGQDQRKSDLCAQWKAADSANEAARWAWWALVIGTIGTFGLFATLYWTRKAVHVAMEATKDADAAIAIAERSADAAVAQVAVAQDTAYRELRAYMNPGEAWLEVSHKDGAVLFTLGGFIVNNGKTPAVLKEQRAEIKLAKGGEAGGSGGAEYRGLDFIIAPGFYHEIGGNAFGGHLGPFEEKNTGVRVGYLFTYADYLGKEWTEVIWWRSDPIMPGKLGRIPLAVSAHRQGPDEELLWMDDEMERRRREHAEGKRSS